MGYVFSEKGISADPQKVAAIKNATRPENASELQSLLGLANYCSRFIPGFSTMVKPLRELTTNGTTWKWNDKAEKVLEELKESISAACVMSYYDQQKETEVLVDASPVGLGAILTQNSKAGGTEVTQYASRALTPVEQRYSQTEREALAIVFGCERFSLYLLGKPFVVVTDHKPLVPIFNNRQFNPPARIQRLSLRLQQFNFTLKYHPGKTTWQTTCLDIQHLRYYPLRLKTTEKNT